VSRYNKTNRLCCSSKEHLLVVASRIRYWEVVTEINAGLIAFQFKSNLTLRIFITTNVLRPGTKNNSQKIILKVELLKLMSAQK